MCLPDGGASIALAALSIATSVAGGVVGAIGQRQQAQAQANYQAQMAEARNQQILQNQRRAALDYQKQSEAINARQGQEEKAAANQIFNAQTEARRLQAEQVVSSGEAGVSGLSIDALMADFERQQLNQSETIRQQRDFSSFNAQLQKEALQRRAENLGNTIQPYIPSPVAGPNMFGQALSIGGNALSTGLKFNQMGAFSGGGGSTTPAPIGPFPLGMSPQPNRY